MAAKGKTKADKNEYNPLQFNLTIAGRQYSEDLSKQVQFELNPKGISEAIAQNPAMYAHWATLQVFAKQAREEAEEKLATLEAELYEKFNPDGDAKVTDVRNKVKADPKRKVLVDEVHKAKETHRLVRVGAETIGKKIDSVFEAARMYRAEVAKSGSARHMGTQAKDADEKLSQMFDN